VRARASVAPAAALRRRRRFFAELGIVHAVAERDEHRLVLLAHQALHDLLQVGTADVLAVARLSRRDDATAVREEVRHDVRMLDARVLGLDVIELSVVADVRVVTEERRRTLHRSRT
jgi:hypothetical protein